MALSLMLWSSGDGLLESVQSGEVGGPFFGPIYRRQTGVATESGFCDSVELKYFCIHAVVTGDD